MTDYEARYEETPVPRRGPGFLSAFIGKAILLALTIVVVWLLYGYLFAFQLDFLGWSYTKLQPLTNHLYALVDGYFPDSIRYKFRAAITDDLGQRALFLLILTAVVELALFTIFRFLKFLFLGSR
jgi:ABC-type Na+ efflux pump permease subunit